MMARNNGIVRRSVTHTEEYLEPIPIDSGSNSGSDPVAEKLLEQPWVWIGAIAVGLSFAQQLGVSIDFGTHARSAGSEGTTIINNKN